MAEKRIHSYAASFGRDLARSLLMEHGSKSKTVLDPFMGSGTTLLEALSVGAFAMGIDVDPIACLISRTLTRKYSVEWLEIFEKKTLLRISQLEDDLITLLSKKTEIDISAGSSILLNGYQLYIPEFEEIDYWFSTNQKLVLASLIAHLNTLLEQRQYDIFSLSISSSIIRKWPNSISCAMDIDHSRPHRVTPERQTIEEYFFLFKRVFRTSIRILKRLVSESKKWVCEANIIEGNCEERLFQLEASFVDLILTSPPYVNAIDYPRAHKFSEWWLFSSENSSLRSSYIGLRGLQHEKKYISESYTLAPYNLSKIESQLQENNSSSSGKVFRYISDMGKVIDGCRHVLKENGILIFVLADNQISGKVLPVVDIISEILIRKEFRNVTISRREIDRSRRRYPFGFKGVMTSEAVIRATK